MPSKCSLWWIFFSAVVFVLAASDPVPAKEPPPDWRIPGSSYQGFIGNGRDENGLPCKILKVGYEIYHYPPGLKNTQLFISGEYSVIYPHLKAEQIVPIGGTLYQVEGTPRVGGDFLSIIRRKPPEQPIPAQVSVKELPEEILPAPTSYTVPLDGFGQLRGHAFQVVAIHPPPESGKPTAEIQWFIGPSLHTKGGRSTIETGGDLRYGPRTFRIRKIVPPDAKRHLIGWIELDPEPRVPDAPVAPWPLKTPLPEFPHRTTQGHLNNYEIWSPRSNPWFIHTPWIGEAKAVDPRDFTVNFPGSKPGYPAGFQSGQRVPILGNIYEMRTMNRALRPNAAFLVDPKDLPENVACSPNSFAVPLKGFGRLHGPWFQIATITQTGDQPPTAKIEAYGEHRWDPTDKYEVTSRAVVKRGTLVSLGKNTYRVVNVVPADAEHKIAGWVEFDPVPVQPDSEKE